MQETISSAKKSDPDFKILKKEQGLHVLEEANESMTHV